MIKSDGSVMVHADTGGYKSQNCGWAPGPVSARGAATLPR
jgi:hypothetical protein